MAWSRVLTFTDPLSCQAAILSADVEILPTTREIFQAEITQVGTDRLWTQHFHVSSPQVCTIAYKPGRQSIDFLTGANSSPLQHCGVDVLPDDIIVNALDVVHRRSGPNLAYGSMSLPINELHTAFAAIVGGDFVQTVGQPIIHPRPELMSRLLKLHKVVGQLAHDTPDVLQIPEVLRALENELVHTMTRCLAEGGVVETSRGQRRHKTIIARFEEFLAANSDRPLYLIEICAGIGVAERTLRGACEEHVGMGPIRFLTLRRMHLVRRALLRADLLWRHCRAPEHAGRERIGSCRKDARQLGAQETQPLPHRDSALQHEGADLIDDARALTDKPLAHPVRRLQVELIGRLGGDELHGWALHRLGDRFRIAIVVLLTFGIRAHILCRHQPRVVTQFL
jgi:AraC-like DNA-binding protein